MGRKLSTAALATLLLGGAKGSPGSLEQFRREQNQAQNFARALAERRYGNELVRKGKNPLNFHPPADNNRSKNPNGGRFSGASEMYLQRLKIMRNRRQYNDLTSLRNRLKDRYETAAAKSIAAKWAQNGVMPQHIFDAVIETKVPHLGEWDVFAHGRIDQETPTTLATFVVPRDTVVVFWNVPGTSTVVSTKSTPAYWKLQPIPNRSVTSKARTGNATARKGAYSVMHVEGDVIPEVKLKFSDPKIQMGVFKSATGHVNTTRNLDTSLSSFLKTNGPGVYYVLSCRYDPYDMDPDYMRGHVQRTQNARQRQLKYSDKRAFKKFSSYAASGYQQFNNMRLSGFDPQSIILHVLCGFVIPYIMMAGKTVGFIKGGSITEMIALLGLASTGSAGVKLLATNAVWNIAATLAKNKIFNYQKKITARIQKLEKSIANGKTPRELNDLRKMKQYGFTTRDPIALKKQYKDKARIAMLSRKGTRNVDEAYAIALKRIPRNGVLTTGIRHMASIITSKPKTSPRLMDDKTTDRFLKKWGFKRGMSQKMIGYVAAKYTLLNRIRGKVPPEFTYATSLALQFKK